MKLSLCAVLVMWAGAVQAIELQLPASARQMIARDTEQDRFFVPVGVIENGALPTLRIDGDVARSAWRIDVAGLTPLQLIAPLRAQLDAAGYELVLDCAALGCGGYDFRFEMEVLPAPNMYVNIRNFHVLTGLRKSQSGGDEAITILASASSGASFVQIIQVGDGTQSNAVETVLATPSVVTGAVQKALADRLSADGFAVLGGLDFNSGTADLGSGPFDALAVLAQALRAAPDLRIALVGHTDNVGSLEGNIALSRNRAASVRQRMIELYEIEPARMDAEGMGYLSPLMTNQTEAGREANRRVEAVVLAN